MHFLLQLFVNFEKSFKFDRVFGPTSTQEGVFSLCVRPLLEECLLDGRHVAVIAYGQTGTGKTFTMGTDHKVAWSAVDVPPPPVTHVVVVVVRR